MKNTRTGLFILLATAAIVVIFLLMRRGGEHHEAAAQVKVTAEVAEVGLESVEILTDHQGTLEPVQEATLSPKILSTVAAVLVREGDRVRKGQPLVRLEAADLASSAQQASAAYRAASANALSAVDAAKLEEEAAKADIAAALASLKQAQEQLSLVREGARKQERASASLAVQQAKAQYDIAHSEAGRMRSLYQQDVVSKQRLEQAETAEILAKAAYETAKQQESLVAEGSRTQEVRAAEERVRQAQAGLAAARTRKISTEIRRKQATAAQGQAEQAKAGLSSADVMLGYSVIRSPFDGVVSKRLVDPGDQVGPGSPVITVEDRSGWQMTAAVPESDAVMLRIGKPVKVKIDSLGSGVLQASVKEIRPAGDPTTRTAQVKASIKGDPRFRSGLFGRLIISKGAELSLTIPTSAIIDKQGMPRVWLVDKNGRATLRMLTLGREVEDRIVVLSGLARGDRIIVSNVSAITEGAIVEEAGQ